MLLDQQHATLLIPTGLKPDAPGCPEDGLEDAACIACPGLKPDAPGCAEGGLEDAACIACPGLKARVA